MNEPEIFILADRTLNGVVTQIKDGQWAMEMPPSFATGQVDHVPTLREIVNYHAYDDSWVPDMLAAKPWRRQVATTSKAISWAQPQSARSRRWWIERARP